MKITLFTGNQPRHVSLANRLAEIADEVFVCQEAATLFPGKVEDFYKKSIIMQNYFTHVVAAEKKIFGLHSFTHPRVRSLSMKSNDLNFLSMDVLAPALEADVILVFGASYIKAPLIEKLIEKKAINIHMGISPYYRGCDCNFWAVYDKRADMMGATIHYLSKGIDSGPMLFHALPPREKEDPFVLGMKSVRSAHSAVIKAIKEGKIFDYQPIIQDKSLERKYTRSADFNDKVAEEYLSNLPTPNDIESQLKMYNPDDFLFPYIEG